MLNKMVVLDEQNEGRAEQGPEGGTVGLVQRLCQPGHRGRAWGDEEEGLELRT